MFLKKFYAKFVFWGFFFVFGCKIQTKLPVKSVGEKPPDVYAYKINIDEFYKDKKKWHLTGEKMQQFDNKNKLFITNLSIIFYDNNEPTSSLAADSGEMDMVSRNITFLGNITLANEKENFMLKCRKLVYTKHLNTIFVPDTVFIKKGMNILHGRKLHSDVNLTNIKMQNISGSGKINSDDF